MLLVRSDSVATTYAIAAELARVARPGDVIVLAGDMGSGKTAFAQGFGRALGVTEPITSPTFTLVHSYPCGKLTLHHADLYRLDHTAEVADLALAELAEFGGIVLVEWGDVVAGAFGDHLEVRLVVDDDDVDDADGPDAEAPEGDGAPIDGRRTIELSATGPAWAARWARLSSAMEAFA
jgi:tRNA threonylcarbamoyladenosine biosynthesis protein TsaE